MAKCVITFEDGEGEGQVHVNLAFEPPIDSEAGGKPTPAQYVANKLFSQVMASAGSGKKTPLKKAGNKGTLAKASKKRRRRTDRRTEWPPR